MESFPRKLEGEYFFLLAIETPKNFVFAPTILNSEWGFSKYSIWQKCDQARLQSLSRIAIMVSKM